MINSLQIDKSKWISVKLGEVVFEPKESVKNIIAEGIEHVVGLEHIDSEDVHLRKSASIEESTTFTKKFSQGDVLFGRRRAYLKKAAQASFSGICSGDITVLRAKGDLSESLLPFIIHNDKFFDWAITHSAGGLSPRVKFKDLANYEFLLPPKEEQARLAELLWSMDEVIEREKMLLGEYNQFFKRFLIDSISGKLSKNRDKWKEYKFGDLGDSFGGLSGKTKDDFGDSGVPFITYMNVFSNYEVSTTEAGFVNIKMGEKQNQLKYGDILVTGSSETPNELGMSSVVLDDLSGFYLNSFCFGFRLHNFNTLTPEYAQFLMRGEEVRSFMYKHAQGATRFNLSKTTLKAKLKLKIPTTDEQGKIFKDLKQKKQNQILIQDKLSNSESLQKSLINKIF